MKLRALLFFACFAITPIFWAQSSTGQPFAWSWGDGHGQSSREVLAMENGDFVLMVRRHWYSLDPKYRYGLSSILLYRFSPEGKVKWTRHLGGKAQTWGNSMTLSPDGEIVLTGTIYPAGQQVERQKETSKLYVVKVKGDGSVAWENSFGQDFLEEGLSIIPAKGGGYCISGISTRITGPDDNRTNDLYLLKIDETGAKEWESIHPNPIGASYPYGLARSTGNDYLMVQSLPANEELKVRSLYITDFDKNGQKGEDRPLSELDLFPISVLNLEDGGLVIAGSTGMYGNKSSFILRLDQTGEILWLKTYPKIEMGKSRIIRTSDGGFALTGSIKKRGRYNDQYQVVLLKTNEKGEEEWQQSWAPESGDWFGKAVCELKDGGFMVAGSHTPMLGLKGNIALLKVKPNGMLDSGVPPPKGLPSKE